MALIYFVRHAETTMNAQKHFAGRIDCNITPKGKLAASKLSDTFPFNKEFDAIYTSTLKRTHQTLLAIYPSITEFTITPDLDEISLGPWEGKLKSSIDPKLIENFRNGTYMPKGSKDISHKDVEARLTHFINECRNSGKENILAVTHNGIIKTLKRMYNLEPGPTRNLGYIVLDI